MDRDEAIEVLRGILEFLALSSDFEYQAEHPTDGDADTNMIVVDVDRHVRTFLVPCPAEINILNPIDPPARIEFHRDEYRRAPGHENLWRKI